MVKTSPAKQETWVQPLGWEDPLEEGMAICSNVLAWRIFMGRGAWRAAVHRVGCKESDMTERLSTAQPQLEKACVQHEDLAKPNINVTVVQLLGRV